MEIVLLHDHYSKEHLLKVIEDMKVLGVPTIRAFVVMSNNKIQAIEGCHRLRACKILGIKPNIEFIESDLWCSEVEGLDCDFFADEMTGDLESVWGDVLIF